MPLRMVVLALCVLFLFCSRAVIHSGTFCKRFTNNAVSPGAFSLNSLVYRIIFYSDPVSVPESGPHEVRRAVSAEHGLVCLESVPVVELVRGELIHELLEVALATTSI